MAFINLDIIYLEAANVSLMAFVPVGDLLRKQTLGIPGSAKGKHRFDLGAQDLEDEDW